MIWTEDRLLLITATPGFKGHQLGRKACAHKNVYWYDTVYNGPDPLVVTPNDETAPDYIQGPKLISLNHYHTEMRDGRYVPGIGDLILQHWDSIDEWKIMFIKRMEHIHDVDEKYLPIITHLVPEQLHELFPTAKIISLIGYDVDRYLETTSKFPYFYEFNGQKQEIPNAYTTRLNELHDEHPDMTFEEYWTLTNVDSDITYRESVEEMVSGDKYFEHENVLNIYSIDDDITEFLNYSK